MRASLLDAERPGRDGRGRLLRTGATGLFAAAVLLAVAWQAWGAESTGGAISLVQIDFGSGGTPVVTSSAADVRNGITAEVNGLSDVRKKLSSSLKPLQKLRLNGPTSAPSTEPAPPALRGRDEAVVPHAHLPQAAKKSLARLQQAAKKKTDQAHLQQAAKKKDDKKKEKKATKLAACGCCSKPGPCGCCGSTSSDASIHNTGFFLNGNTIARGSNVIIYGTGATVTHSGGGVANGGGAGSKGGAGGAGGGSYPGSGSKGGGVAGGGGAGGGAGGGPGGGQGGKAAGAAGGTSASAAGGVVRKKMDKKAREVARKKARHEMKKVLARRPTNPNYARYVSTLTKNYKRLFRGYVGKMMHYRRQMSAIKDKGGKDWVAAYKLYGHYARKMKHWYSSWGMFLARRRRSYKKCTKKFKKCGMYKYLTKKMKLNRSRYGSFQGMLRKRIRTWSKQVKADSKEGKRIAQARKRAKRVRKQQKRARKARKDVKRTRKYARGSSKYKKAVKETATRFQKMLDFYRARKDKWLKYAAAQKACSSSYHRGFRYVKYYARREMRMLRSIRAWLSRRRRTMKRSSKEYAEVSKEMKARSKEMSDAYKGLYKHYKIVWHCYKKGTRTYRRWYRRYHSAHKWYGRAKAARNARYKRKARRNKKKAFQYPACGKRAQARAERISKRWKKILGRYTKYVDYWNKKAKSRKLGTRYWRSAWYHWRRNIWREYRWYWWLIKFDSKMSRYLKRCPDLLKATRARLKEDRAARSTLITSYRKEQAEWSKALQSKDKNSKAAKRARRSVRRQKAQVMWRGYYHNWIGWERKFFKTRPGRKDERLALYKMRKWRSQYMAYFRARIKDYDKKVATAKKGSRVYEARWNYAMVYRYYYLYGLKRTTWFQGRQLRRYKKGSKNWLKVYRARAKSFRTQINYLSVMRSMLRKHIYVCKKGSSARRKWWHWYRWSSKWYNRYRAAWRSMKKRSSSKKSRRVWRSKARTKAWYRYVTGITHRWYRIMKYYKRKQMYWRGRLYKYRPGSYRWRRAWNYYRSYNYRVVRWGSWYVRFLRHLRRYWRSGTSGWKKINSSVLRWKAYNKRYRAQWRHRISYWSKRLSKKNAKGKAYKRVQRRQSAASAWRAFRKTWKSWYYAMYYSYRTRYDSATFKKYYPQVNKLSGEVLKFYEDRANYYKGQMGKHKARSKAYSVYFRYYMIYKYRILHAHYYSLWFDKKMYHRFRKGTAEEKEMKHYLHDAHKNLKLDYYRLMSLTRHRLGQVRNRSAEWNLWHRWYRWSYHRAKRFQGRRRYRARKSVNYWWHRFTKGKIGGKTQTYALKYLDRYYKYLLKKYTSRETYWKGRLAKARWGSTHWSKCSRYYVRYLRKRYHWLYWRATFYKRWRRMYKSSSGDYKKLTEKRKAVMEERKKIQKAYMSTVQDWISHLPHSSYAYKSYSKWYKRYGARYARYRSPVKDLRKAEHAWWAMRRSSYKDAKYRAAFTAMKVARGKVLRKYVRAGARWAKVLQHAAKHKYSKSFMYAFRRMMLYQYYLYREYHRGASFTRYAMTHKVDRKSSWFRKLSASYRQSLSGMGGVYHTIHAYTRWLLKGLNHRSYYYRYWYRWYRWGSYRLKRYRRWYSAWKKRSVTRRRRSMWHYKYKSTQYWRYYKRVWSLWLRVWVKYHKRLNYWRTRLHREQLASGRWRSSYYRTMRYQGRVAYWIGYWIHFQRKLQRVYSKKGTSQFAAYQRTIDAWKKYRTAWNKIFAQRVGYWYKRLERAKKTSTYSYRVVRRYYKRYGGRTERRNIVKELRAVERKVYYSKKVDDADVKKMDDLRGQYVALIDAGVKKYTEYIDKQKKGSHRYIWGYRRFFAYSYWGIREYKRGYTIASIKGQAKQKAKDWTQTHNRLYALWERFNADKKGLYKRSWLYRALTGTEYWMRKRFAVFLNPSKTFKKGPWPTGSCYPLDDACKKLGVTDNLCGKCEADGKGWKLTNMEAGLRWGGKSFDDNQNGKGTLQAQNICALAAYGNKGKITKKPTADCAGKTNYKVSGQVHWFGNCAKGGCAGCTNAAPVKDGFDWNKFASGNSCRSDSDRDATLGTVSCFFA